MGLLKKYLSETYSDIDDQNNILHLSFKIKVTIKERLKRDINDLLIFYSVKNNNLHLVRLNLIVCLYIVYISYLTAIYYYLYYQKIVNNNNEILHWMEVLKSNDENINPVEILIL